MVKKMSLCIQRTNLGFRAYEPQNPPNPLKSVSEINAGDVVTANVNGLKKSFVVLSQPDLTENSYDALVFEHDSHPEDVGVKKLFGLGKQSPTSKAFAISNKVGHLDLLA